MGKSPFTMPGSGFYGKGNQSVTPGKYAATHGSGTDWEHKHRERPAHSDTAEAHNRSASKYKSPAKHTAKLGVDSESQDVIDTHAKYHRDNPNAGKNHEGGKRAEFDKEGNLIIPEKNNKN